MEDDDNMLNLPLHMVSLAALWDTDVASEPGINLCAKACIKPVCTHWHKCCCPSFWS